MMRADRILSRRGAQRPGTRPPAPQAGAFAPTSGGRVPLSAIAYSLRKVAHV